MLGKFITFEGGEGSGKSTLIQNIEGLLKEEGLDIIKTREPGGSPLGEQIRQWLLNHDETISVGQQAEVLLFLASRAQHLDEVIFPAVEEGKVVLCDRFHDSTIAYQGKARKLGMEKIESLCLLSCYNRWPDITFYIDIDPEVGLARTRKLAKDNAPAETMDRIESEALRFHKDVREGYRLLAKKFPKRIHTLDGKLSPKELAEQTVETILAKMGTPL